MILPNSLFVKRLTAAQEVELGFQVQRLMQAQELYKINTTPNHTLKPFLEQQGLQGQALNELVANIVRWRAAKDKMVAANIRLVIKQVSFFPENEKEDAIQDGILGLIRGVEKYDPTKGYRLSTYVTWWIKQAISRRKRELIVLPSHITEKNKKIQKAIASCENKTISEIAAKTNMTEKTVNFVLKVVAQSQNVASLDAPVKAQDTQQTLLDIVPDNNNEEPRENRCIKEAVAMQLDMLPFKQRIIAQLRYNLRYEGDEDLFNALDLMHDGLITGQDIAEILGISRQRVQQLERALDKQLQLGLSSFRDAV